MSNEEIIDALNDINKRLMKLENSDIKNETVISQLSEDFLIFKEVIESD